MNLPKWVAIVLIISLLLNVKTALDLNHMKNDISDLRNNVNSVNDSVNIAVSNSVNRINEALDKKASLVSEFKYDVAELKDKRVDYLFSLKPKVYNKGESLSLLLKIGENNPQLIQTETKDNITFTSKVNMSIFEAAEVNLIIDDGSSKKIEKMESIYPAVERFALGIQGNPLGGSMRYDKGNSDLIMTFDFELSVNSNTGDESPVLDNINLHVEVNGKIIDTVPMPRDAGNENRYYVQLKDYKIPSKAGDRITIYATTKDNKGFNYKCNFEGWTINENGEIDHAPYEFETGRVEIN